MSNLNYILTEYFSQMYTVVNVLSDDGSVCVVKNEIDEKLYVCKSLTHYDVTLYNRLKHLHIKGIPQIYEMVETEEGLLIIEDYIDGKVLSEIDVIGNDKENWITNFAISMCDIISELHHLDPPVIHRDIKPENIIYYEDSFYLVDFNISREYTGEKNKDTFIMGTRDFAAPEQYGFLETDVRTDIYGLGATLKYLCEKYDVRSKKLEKVIIKAMEFDPKNRYGTMNEFKSALINGKAGEMFNFLKRYALPGFRRGNIFFMLLALVYYILAFYMVYDFKMGGNEYIGFKHDLYDAMGGSCLAIIIIFVTLFSADYLGIRTRLLTSLNVSVTSRLMNILITVLIDIVFVTTILLIYIIASYMIFF